MLTQDIIRREIYEAREKARRDAADWKNALQRAEERVRNSFAQGSKEGHAVGLAEGLEEGRQVGELIGQIRLCEQLLRRPPHSDDELMAMPPDVLSTLAEALRAELLAGN